MEQYLNYYSYQEIQGMSNMGRERMQPRKTPVQAIVPAATDLSLPTRPTTCRTINEDHVYVNVNGGMHSNSDNSSIHAEEGAVGGSGLPLFVYG